MEWFTGDRVTWHDDGEPSQSANGYLYGWYTKAVIWVSIAMIATD